MVIGSTTSINSSISVSVFESVSLHIFLFGRFIGLAIGLSIKISIGTVFVDKFSIEATSLGSCNCNESLIILILLRNF